MNLIGKDRPLFLSVISAYKHKKITEQAAEQFFKVIKNFYFGYGVVCGGKSNSIEDMVYQYAQKIEKGDALLAIQELNIKLKQYYPDYKTFEAHFILLGWSHCVKNYKTTSKKKVVQYILSSIEEYYLEHNRELAVLNFTLEHIANDDGTSSHCMIGNLLMLAEPINENAANKMFTDKISYYKSSNFVSTKNFVQRYHNFNEWGDNEIENRGKYMAKLAYDVIWRFE